MPEGERSFNPLDLIRNRVQKTVAEARMPTESFDSTMMVYGGKLTKDAEGKMVWDRRGPVSKVDKSGDYLLRTYDEHVMAGYPLKLLRIDKHHWHPGWMVKFFMPGAKRHRGSNEEIVENAQRLGLGEYYGAHPWGIEVRKPEVFTKGIPFQDVLRADLVGSDQLNQIDRFQAIGETAKYLRYVHDMYGGIGEGVPYRFIFQHQTGNKVSDPILFIPDIVYNKTKYDPKKFKPGSSAPALDQKATDYLEFLISLGFEEFRRSEDWNMVDKALALANTAYGDPKVISVTESFAKRGRVTMDHPIFSQHNRVHLGFDPKYTDAVRQKVIESCEAFKKQSAT